MKWCCMFFALLIWYACNESKSNELKKNPDLGEVNTASDEKGENDSESPKAPTPVLDTALYDKLVLSLSHDSTDHRWPVKAPRPLPGALLPFHRVVAYYGNFYSSGMGILGALPTDKMKASLLEECLLWQKADSLHTVIPALHYLAVTAQSSAGKDGMYRLRMPFHQIDKLLEISRSMEGIAFLDVQVGQSTVQREVPLLEKYLIEPDVHLGLDPEWSMKDGSIPGKRIGTLDAADINFAVDYLAELVRRHNLLPKILVVHRFTKGMVTNYKNIKTCPEVQIVINMDGFGFPAKKIDSYRRFVAGEPVQFTGFKLFYKNDTWTPPNRLMTRPEILKLRPRPIYIQYQ